MAGFPSEIWSRVLNVWDDAPFSYYFRVRVLRYPQPETYYPETPTGIFFGASVLVESYDIYGVLLSSVETPIEMFQYQPAPTHLDITDYDTPAVPWNSHSIKIYQKLWYFDAGESGHPWHALTNYGGDQYVLSLGEFNNEHYGEQTPGYYWYEKSYPAEQIVDHGSIATVKLSDTDTRGNARMILFNNDRNGLCVIFRDGLGAILYSENFPRLCDFTDYDSLRISLFQHRPIPYNLWLLDNRVFYVSIYAGPLEAYDILKHLIYEYTLDVSAGSPPVVTCTHPANSPYHNSGNYIFLGGSHLNAAHVYIKYLTAPFTIVEAILQEPPFTYLWVREFTLESGTTSFEIYAKDYKDLQSNSIFVTITSLFPTLLNYNLLGYLGTANPPSSNPLLNNLALLGYAEGAIDAPNDTPEIKLMRLLGYSKEALGAPNGNPEIKLIRLLGYLGEAFNPPTNTPEVKLLSFIGFQDGPSPPENNPELQRLNLLGWDAVRRIVIDFDFNVREPQILYNLQEIITAPVTMENISPRLAGLTSAFNTDYSSVPNATPILSGFFSVVSREKRILYPFTFNIREQVKIAYPFTFNIHTRERISSPIFSFDVKGGSSVDFEFKVIKNAYYARIDFDFNVLENADAPRIYVDFSFDVETTKHVIDFDFNVEAEYDEHYIDFDFNIVALDRRDIDFEFDVIGYWMPITFSVIATPLVPGTIDPRMKKRRVTAKVFNTDGVLVGSGFTTVLILPENPAFRIKIDIIGIPQAPISGDMQVVVYEDAVIKIDTIGAYQENWSGTYGAS